jgi:3-oxoacyl-[acyl-carrier protein] reductase
MVLTKKIAIVTGGGGGIGRGVAIDLARHGATVVVAGIHLSRVQGVHSIIESEGGKCRAVEVDVSDRSAVDALVDRACDEFGRVDILVNTAAHRARGPVAQMSDEDWSRVIDVNLTGTFYVTRAVARPMTAQKSGTMILFASDRGLFGLANGANYAASKGGVIAYAKSLAFELGEHDVTVNVINPGTIPTDRLGVSDAEKEKLAEHHRRRAAANPLGRTNTVEEIAEYVRWLADIGGKFITGQLVTVRSVP